MCRYWPGNRYDPPESEECLPVVDAAYGYARSRGEEEPTSDDWDAAQVSVHGMDPGEVEHPDEEPLDWWEASGAWAGGFARNH